MKKLLKEERPYEKCALSGASNLTDVELLAVLLRTGSKGEGVLTLARNLLQPTKESSGGLLSLHQLTKEQLMCIRGIGSVKATQILCLLELTKRMSKGFAADGLVFSKPETVAKYIMEDMRHESQENVRLLMLNTRSKLLGELLISKGTVNGSVISPRELFIEALHRNAVSIILIHNHPSGDPTPSQEDLSLTRRVKEAGDLIGIELLDHIIIGNNCYISLRQEKLM